MNTYRRLSNVYENSKVIPYDYSSKFVIMSDCHRGSGNYGDNFLKNQNDYQNLKSSIKEKMIFIFLLSVRMLGSNHLKDLLHIRYLLTIGSSHL